MHRKYHMIKTIVSHMGAHKTATSLIQQYFKANREYYKDQGLEIVTRGSVSPFVGLGDKILKRSNAMNSLLIQRSEETDAKMMFYSHEDQLGSAITVEPGLYAKAAELLPHLKKALKGFDVRIVYTIRPQAEFLQSYYLQRINVGEFMTFFQFLDSIDLDRISWIPVINSLKETFGEKNVTIIDFNTIKQGQDFFISEFLRRAVGENVRPLLGYEEVHNPSISDRGLQIAMRINPLLRKGETRMVRKFLQEKFSNQTEPRPVLMTDAMKNEINNKYRSEYESLVSR